MEQDIFGSTFLDAMNDTSAENWAEQVRRNHKEIDDVLEQARAHMQQALPSGITAKIDSWISTPEAEGKQLTFQRDDGYEVKAFTIAVPFDGYPVKVRVGDDEQEARNRDELVGLVKKAMSRPSVAATAKRLAE